MNRGMTASRAVLLAIAAAAATSQVANAAPSYLDDTRERLKQLPIGPEKSLPGLDESKWMLPGEKAIRIDPPAGSAAPAASSAPSGTSAPKPYVPFVFHLLASPDPGTTLDEHTAEFCTATVTDVSGAPELITAAHCLVLPGKKLAQRLWLRRRDLSPSEMSFAIADKDITFGAAEIRQWLGDARRTESVGSVLHPDPNSPSTWRSDFAKVKLSPAAWPATWEKYHTQPTVTTGRGEKITLVGGGCTERDATKCYRDSVDYAMFGDEFVVTGVTQSLIAVTSDPTSRSETRNGDSGGPVFKLAGPNDARLIGIVSTQIWTATFIQRVY